MTMHSRYQLIFAYYSRNLYTAYEHKYENYNADKNTEVETREILQTRKLI